MLPEKPSPRPLGTGRRVEIIDIARGFAMLFVCLSHFASVYMSAEAVRSTASALWSLGMVASPAFVFLSGTLLGVEYTLRRGSFARFQLKLIDRGLFLLTVAHTVMLFSIVPAHKSLPDYFYALFITDAIAFSLLVAPWLMPKLSGRQRVVLGVLLLSVSWLIVEDWSPHSNIDKTLEAMLFGTLDRAWYPVIPWLGIYLASTAFGEHLAGLLAQRAYGKVSWAMTQLGCVLVAGSVVLRAVRWVAVHHPVGLFRETRGLVELTSVWQKYPPGPAYAMFFAGIGICLMAVLIELWRFSKATRLLKVFAAVGQASLFTYLVQAHLYYVVLYYLHLPYVRAWYLVFFATLVPLACAGWWWSKRGMNRYFTVGLPTLVDMIAERRQAALRT